MAAESFRKNLFSERRSEQKPLLVAAKDEQAQADYIVEGVLAHREAGIPLHHQAVLMGTAHHSDLLEIELGRRNIPFVKYGGLKFLEAGVLYGIESQERRSACLCAADAVYTG